MTYIDSHKAPSKGAEYETLYRTNPWEIYANDRERSVLRRILQAMPAPQSVHYLDFACGTGRITGMIENLVLTSTGVDVSESMLAQAGPKLGRTKLILHNVLETDVFDRQTFDLITAFRFFVNAESSLRNAALAYLATKLSPAGCLVLNIHQNSQSLYVRAGKLIRHLRPPRPHDADPVNYWSVPEARALLRQHGLRIKKLYSVGLLHLPRLPVVAGPFRWGDDVGSLSSALCQLSSGPVVVAERA